jgi:hypothetical protein
MATVSLATGLPSFTPRVARKQLSPDLPAPTSRQMLEITLWPAGATGGGRVNPSR